MVRADVGVDKGGLLRVDEPCPALGAVVEHTVLLRAADLVPLDLYALGVVADGELGRADELDAEAVGVVPA